ncbi:MAG: hypothetical protein ACK502_06565 [Alphaproteobacteria bacterium]
MNTPNDAPRVTYAYEADHSLRKLIGRSTVLAEVFSADRIASCQNVLDEAKTSFFETSLSDMHQISTLLLDKTADIAQYQQRCQQALSPLHNIQSQAEIFGFSLIARICQYLREYCERSVSKQFTGREMYIVMRLVEALNRAFQQRISDSSGQLETELTSVISKTHAATAEKPSNPA